jgi:F-type H+-transporting ATPase subunit gamma
MPNLKEIRVRIASVNTTKQITSAMKMVSAAKLKRAQDAIIQMRPYASKLKEILADISASLDVADDNMFSKVRPIEKVLIVLVSSNRGMCGAFNANVAKRAIEIAQTKYEKQLTNGNVHFLTIGKKGQEYLKARKYSIVDTQNQVYDKLQFENVIPVAESIMLKFANGEYDVIEVAYNQFKNAAVQNLTDEQFLPVQTNKDKTKGNIKNDYIYEPSKEYIVQELIPKMLKIQLFKAILDSYASEQGARMTAMHKATDNAVEMIRSLTLNYNKARQAAITNQILEVVGGAEALKG